MPEIFYWIAAGVVFMVYINAMFGEFGNTVQGVTMAATAIFCIVGGFIVNFVIGMCAIVFFILLLTSVPHTNPKAKPRRNPADDFAPIEVRLPPAPEKVSAPVATKVESTPSLPCKNNVKKLIG